MGEGSNNLTELVTLRTLLKLTFNFGIRDIELFGDSTPAVKWMLGT